MISNYFVLIETIHNCDKPNKITFIILYSEVINLVVPINGSGNTCIIEVTI